MSAALEHMWAKSDTSGGRAASPVRQSVMAHLLDSAGVAGVIWDRWLSEIVKARVDHLSAGRSISGRDILRCLAGIHDLGKISPAFQAKQPALNTAITNLHLAGLATCVDDADAKKWHHTRAGGAAIRTLLTDTPWAAHGGWMSSVIGGHHGVYPTEGDYRVAILTRRTHGIGEWDDVRREALTRLLGELQIVGPGDGLADLPLFDVPTPADQVILTGAVIMADWIASNGTVMPGLWSGQQIDAETSRARAEQAWDTLNLTGGWAGRSEDLLTAGVFAARFGRGGQLQPRDTQRVVEQLAAGMDAPGLLIVEAPMGEGKTEAALVACEIMAAKFGMNGVFFGLPTQATSDAMFERVNDWLATHWPGAPLGLAHGKSVVNKTLREMRPWRSDGVYDDRGPDTATAMAPSEWFEARKRLLLLPFLVGTIDNLLLAGAQVRHLPLYHAAFANKVVVLDEVHAADYLDAAVGRGHLHEPVSLPRTVLARDGTSTGDPAVRDPAEHTTRGAARRLPRPQRRRGARSNRGHARVPACHRRGRRPGRTRGRADRESGSGPPNRRADPRGGRTRAQRRRPGRGELAGEPPARRPALGRRMRPDHP